MCGCLFVDYSHVLSTYKLIYTRVLISRLDIIALCRPYLLSSWFLMVLVRSWFMSAWFTFIASSRTHISYLVSFGLKLVLTSVFIYIYSVYLDCVLNNIEGVRIPCLCILYPNVINNLCTNLGELPYFI